MNVLLIDDHPLILSALQIVVRALDDDVEVTSVETAQAARDALSSGADFDLALLDLRIGNDNGFELLSELRAAYPAMAVVIVAASERRVDVMRAIDLGAMGFVSKQSGNETLLQALRMVLSGGVYVPAAIMRSEEPALSHWHAGDRTPSAWSIGPASSAGTEAALARLGLTRRQSEVLALLLRGQSNKLIARALNLSVETIKDHVAAILRALKVSSRTQAVLVVSEMSATGGPLPRREQLLASRVE
jgi:DNA-binding NarL/FixJ family response regulator